MKPKAAVTIPLAVAAWLTGPAAGQAQEARFALDMEPDKVEAALGVQDATRTRLADLREGAVGYGYPHYCRQDGALFVYGDTALADAPLTYILNARVTRRATGGVDITLERGAKARVSATDRQRFARAIGSAHHCAAQDAAGLIPVNSFDGQRSLSALVGAVQAPAVTPGADTAPTPPTDPTGRAALAREWFSNDEVDPITDQRNVFRSKVPLEQPRNKFGTDKYVSLMARCQRNTTSVIISFDDFQIQDRVAVTTRFDRDAPDTAQWTTASNKQAVGLWDGAGAIPFVRRMMGAQKLVVRLALEDAVETYSFELNDAMTHLRPVAEACGWTP